MPARSASDAERRAMAFADGVATAFIAEAERASLSRSGVATIVDRSFDLTAMAAAPVSDRWRAWSEPDRQRYVRAYRIFVVAQTHAHLGELRGASWRVLGARSISGSRVAVFTRLVRRGGREHDLEWIVRQVAGPRIVGSTIDGVDVARREREAFLPVLDGRGGLDALIVGLTEGRVTPGAGVVP